MKKRKGKPAQFFEEKFFHPDEPGKGNADEFYNTSYTAAVEDRDLDDRKRAKSGRKTGLRRKYFFILKCCDDRFLSPYNLFEMRVTESILYKQMTKPFWISIFSRQPDHIAIDAIQCRSNSVNAMQNLR